MKNFLYVLLYPFIKFFGALYFVARFFFGLAIIGLVGLWLLLGVAILITSIVAPIWAISQGMIYIPLGMFMVGVVLFGVHQLITDAVTDWIVWN